PIPGPERAGAGGPNARWLNRECSVPARLDESDSCHPAPPPRDEIAGRAPPVRRRRELASPGRAAHRRHRRLGGVGRRRATGTSTLEPVPNLRRYAMDSFRSVAAVEAAAQAGARSLQLAMQALRGASANCAVGPEVGNRL